MKKIVLATLLTAVTSIASAQVAITGKLSKYLDSTNSGSGAHSQLITEPTSNIALSAGEKLGNGMTARVMIETSLSGNTISGSGTKLGDRQATVGLTHKLGTVDFGRNVHSLFLAITNNDVFGTLYGSVAGDVHNLRGLRMGDAVFVSAPVGMVNVAYERSNTIAGADATVMAVGSSLAGFTGSVARFESGNERSTVLGLRTKMNGTNITFTHSDDRGLVNSRGTLIGLSRNFDNITGKVSFGTTNQDVSAFNVGADYNFSKRTALSVAYRDVDRPGKAYDVRQVGVGITHLF